MNDQTIIVYDPTSSPVVTAARQAGGQGVLERWLATMSPLTIKAYRISFADFVDFVYGSNTPVEQGLQMWVGEPSLVAHNVALAYIVDLKNRGLSNSTINSRLSSLRSFVKQASTQGLCEWALNLPSEKRMPYRDATGYPVEVLRGLIASCDNDGEAGIRDRALLYLMIDSALRAASVVGLRRGDVDLKGRRIKFVPKGRREFEWKPVSTRTRDALSALIKSRGSLGDADAIFVTLDPIHKGDYPLTLAGLEWICARRGDKIGVAGIHPHGLRHSAATILYNATSDLKMVQELLGHGSRTTTERYIDSVTNQSGVASKLLEGLV